VSSTYTQHNNLNQLDQIGGAGRTLVEGVVDEPAFVKINGQDAIVLSQPRGDFLFRKEIAVTEGSNTIIVEATDASGNRASNTYSIVVGGVQKTLEYDLNGNLRFEKNPSGGTVLREFQWDAMNRLVKIIDGTTVSEFEYDALDRRVRIVEKENAAVQSDETYLWADGDILQKRASNGQTVQRSYFVDGFEEGSSDYFVTRDHLGSVREVIASNGQTVEAVYEYTVWGEVTRTSGTGVESDFLYTGHLYHDESDLHLTLYRAYHPELGMWLSRDPIEQFRVFLLRCCRKGRIYTVTLEIIRLTTLTLMGNLHGLVLRLVQEFPLGLSFMQMAALAHCGTEIGIKHGKQQNVLIMLMSE